MSATERRSAQRFEMKVSLVVRWMNGAAAGEAITESKNVSSRGIYFFLPKDVKKGSPMEILMTLPHEITQVGPVKVRCLGRVQRIEPQEKQKIGIVVAIERYEFLRGDESVA